MLGVIFSEFYNVLRWIHTGFTVFFLVDIQCNSKWIYTVITTGFTVFFLVGFHCNSKWIYIVIPTGFTMFFLVDLH